MKRAIALVLTLILMFSLASCGLDPAGETWKIDEGETRLIAHRGLSGLKTENTVAAFVAAGERSYYGIEADVKRTADGGFIICHDDTLEKLTGQGIRVEDSTIEELLEVEISDRAGEERLARLEEFISVCKTYDKQAILEFKSSFTEAEVKKIIEIITDLGYIHRTTFISFNYTLLTYVRKELPGASCQYLAKKIDEATVDRLIRDGFDLGVSYSALTLSALERLHAADREVNCWTVNSKWVAELLISIGVDYITTDILE